MPERGHREGAATPRVDLDDGLQRLCRRGGSTRARRASEESFVLCNSIVRHILHSVYIYLKLIYCFGWG